MKQYDRISNQSKIVFTVLTLFSDTHPPNRMKKGSLINCILEGNKGSEEGGEIMLVDMDKKLF